MPIQQEVEKHIERLPSMEQGSSYFEEEDYPEEIIDLPDLPAPVKFTLENNSISSVIEAFSRLRSHRQFLFDADMAKTFTLASLIEYTQGNIGSN